ncbi:hypothetical protein K7432_002683 [Basidiobolus ranarum]|uniref:polynucleotide adenylyltransferase n=1 Tax=Basidiobolus ranarum TaxID=34480 RepID=A0ABR2X1F9_9FUNG
MHQSDILLTEPEGHFGFEQNVLTKPLTNTTQETTTGENWEPSDGHLDSEISSQATDEFDLNPEVKPLNNTDINKPTRKGLRQRLSREEEESLTLDMLALFETLRPTPESIELRHLFVQKLQNIVNVEWPDKYIKVHLFGSSANLLSTSTSDVDICILTDWDELTNVHVLAACMRKHGMRRVYCIAGAKVPIVKMWDPELKLACDININHPISLRNTEMIRTYVAIDPRVRLLVMIIKYWTKRRVLNDAGVGGTLSTYTWVNMILNFLQMRNPPVLPNLQKMAKDRPDMLAIIDGVDTSFYDDFHSLIGFGDKNKETLGGLLFAFFKYFAYDFDYDRHVISLREGEHLLKTDKGWHTGKLFRVLCVEEPFSPERNLGNSADEWSIEGIREEFKRAFDILSKKNDLRQMCQKYVFLSKPQQGGDAKDRLLKTPHDRTAMELSEMRKAFKQHFPELKSERGTSKVEKENPSANKWHSTNDRSKLEDFNGPTFAKIVRHTNTVVTKGSEHINHKSRPTTASKPRKSSGKASTQDSSKGGKSEETKRTTKSNRPSKPRRKSRETNGVSPAER